ncbi:hypothetical protein PICMEDRAFT_70028 [Pichia membranifaciens NRRL Y-2026]|uniref:trans-L-3-hydroxyproline dehydratase n=1 Tax=Pichia membranifaciens NRRL Y-2026 TaxID=763406 RepID=A0A1E3NQQ9_9ASCO|nr:hypothetical protein PICMEDRAFT_70028 [Pichia membranifaciens NRRL Y-2026]ODQ48386.1 hypothetical protein PICMEDRAFT_70028 [Pichia membranifaciens NRRL Y-2026]
MNTAVVTTIETHTCGEPFRIVTSGLPKRIPGATLLDKRNYIEQHYDHLRKTLMREPRGHYDMFGGILLDPVDTAADADAAILFMNPDGYTDQCGHGMISVVTTLIQHGWIGRDKYRVKPDLMRVMLETAVGVIETEACWNGRKVEFVRFRNTAAFILYRDIPVDTSVGPLKGDIVFNGAFNFFAEVDESVLAIRPENATTIVNLGFEIKRKIKEMPGLSIVSKDFPQIQGLHGVDLINVYHKEDRSDICEPNQRSCLVLGVKQLDRSPCGSGTAGRTAQLCLRGAIDTRDTYVNKSLIGSLLRARVVESGIKAHAGEHDACIVEIEGQANVLGTTSWTVDFEDQIGLEGFVIAH